MAKVKKTIRDEITPKARRAEIIIVTASNKFMNPEGVKEFFYLYRYRIYMPGTFSQIYIQVIFAVKGRQNLIAHAWRKELHQYIAGIIKGKDQKPIIVNGVADHVHCFIGLKPSIAIADLVRDIKNNSSNFINRNKYVVGKFSWQEGYGAFSYSQSQVQDVYKYILNQESHHAQKSFKEEYLNLLRKFEITFDEKYLFDWIN